MCAACRLMTSATHVCCYLFFYNFNLIVLRWLKLNWGGEHTTVFFLPPHSNSCILDWTCPPLSLYPGRFAPLCQAGSLVKRAASMNGGPAGSRGGLLKPSLPSKKLTDSPHPFPFPLAHSCSFGWCPTNFIGVYHEQIHKAQNSQWTSFHAFKK